MSVRRWTRTECGYHAPVAVADPPPTPSPQSQPPLPPRVTRMELAIWATFLLVAILLVVIPVATHSFSYPDIAAWVLVAFSAGVSGYWFHAGTQRAPEWLRPDDYQRFVKSVQRLPGREPPRDPPRPTEPP